MEHPIGCRCPECLAVWDRRVQAGRELFDLLGLTWLGPRQAIGIAQMIRDGDVEWLPERVRERIGRLDPGILESLLRDVLDLPE